MSFAARTENARGPLHYPQFRRALLSRAASTAGDWMQIVAAGWLTYQLTDSAVAVGALTALSRGPAIALSSYGGVLADRFDRRRLGIACCAAQALAAAALAILTWDGEVDLAALYSLTLAIGLANALSNSAIQIAATTTVPPELSKRAIALTSVTSSTARALGPALGGGLVAVLGPGPCFTANALSFVVVVVALATIAPSHEKPAPGSPQGLRETISAARAHQVLAVALVAAGLFATLVAPLQELAPAIARRNGDGAHVLGFLLAALAVGGILGNLVLSRLSERGVARSQLVSGGMLACTAALLSLAADGGYALDIAAMLCAGACWQIIYVETLSVVQLEAPRGSSGRMVGLFYTTFLGGLTVGAMAMGAVFDLAGVDIGLAISAAGLAVYALWRMRGAALDGDGAAQSKQGSAEQ
ncbi:MAG: MFS transporter [Solirubrobacterales bacterium]|nr:MFS transporter [Solirubrobacterales bacterium]